MLLNYSPFFSPPTFLLWRRGGGRRWCVRQFSLLQCFSYSTSSGPFHKKRKEPTKKEATLFSALLRIGKNTTGTVASSSLSFQLDETAATPRKAICPQVGREEIGEVKRRRPLNVGSRSTICHFQKNRRRHLLLLLPFLPANQQPPTATKLVSLTFREGGKVRDGRAGQSVGAQGGGGEGRGGERKNPFQQQRPIVKSTATTTAVIGLRVVGDCPPSPK